MNARRCALAALGIVALTGAGCSNDASTDTTESSTPRDRAVAFAECMRSNGVSAFPDPDASGELTVDGVLNGSSIDPEGPEWTSAIAACEDLQPPGFTGDGRRTPEEQSSALRFADCIREHGVEDFPDPVDGEPLVNTNLIPSSARPGGMDVLNAAMQACGGIAAEVRP